MLPCETKAKEAYLIKLYILSYVENRTYAFSAIGNFPIHAYIRRNVRQFLDWNGRFYRPLQECPAMQTSSHSNFHLAGILFSVCQVSSRTLQKILRLCKNWDSIAQRISVSQIYLS